MAVSRKQLREEVKMEFLSSIIDFFESKEELEELYQQIGRIKDGLPQKKESSHTIILEDDCTNKKVQMELSNSAYKLLYYLYHEDWLDSDDIHFTELDEKKIERFI